MTSQTRTSPTTIQGIGAKQPNPITPTTFAQIKPAKINLSFFGRLNQGNAEVLATTAKTRQSEQGALKEEGIDLLVMPDD